ncbi:MAG: triose-phosphate isomerase [bacterium]|jgi:triosephosphate isomerase
MRKKLLAANWKLYKTFEEADGYAAKLKAAFGGTQPEIDVAVCASFPYLRDLIRAFEGTGIAVGAQNVSEYVEGAYTGEVGVRQLSGYGLRYAILGHSERRNVFGESDKLIRKKLELVLAESELCPILCVGEPLEVREGGEAAAFVANQLDGALSGIHRERVRRLVIAYEPIWAIGTGVNAKPEDAQEMCAWVRTVASDFLSAEVAAEMRVLYGGSIKPANWAAIAAGADVDGGLVGGASLDADAFFELYRITAGRVG